MYPAIVIPLWQSSFFLLTSFVMCLPPAEVQRAGAPQAPLSAVCRDGIDWPRLSTAQSDERALPGEGTGEDKQDSVSLSSQVLLPSFQDPVLVNLHSESNAFCAFLTRQGFCSESPAWHNQYWRNEMQYQSKYLSQGSEKIPISILWDFGAF